jgi:hypothetical protein
MDYGEFLTINCNTKIYTCHPTTDYAKETIEQVGYNTHRSIVDCTMEFHQ